MEKEDRHQVGEEDHVNMKEEIISVEGLRKTYSTGLVTFEALKGVDFKLYQWEIVVVENPH